MKLALYRHFANTLVLSVIASVVFMMWNIKFHRLEECLKGAYSKTNEFTPLGTLSARTELLYVKSRYIGPLIPISFSYLKPFLLHSYLG